VQLSHLSVHIQTSEQFRAQHTARLNQLLTQMIDR